MLDKVRAKVVDADGHVLEPRDTWEKFIDPQYRDRAARIGRDENGLEVLLFDGKPHELTRGILGGLGGADADDELAADLAVPGKHVYEDGCPPGGYDPAARIKVLDQEGIDAVLLYPTLGIQWEGHVTDPALADAYCRAYNRYIVDFCSHDRARLIPVAHINLRDPELATKEMERARKDGCVGIYLSPDPAARGGKSLADPALARFYDAASALDMPVAFHVVARDEAPLSGYMNCLSDDGNLNDAKAAFFFAFLALDVMAAYTQMLVTGVLERHSELKVAVLETGSNWLAAWLDRLDHKYEVSARGRDSALKHKPSFYFDRQCVISADPDETMTDMIVHRFGDDKIIWASDYPHIDSSMNVLADLRESLHNLPKESQDKILGENCLRFYNI
jgi:predicted TIM-barrel fold metal-dependent hydrolase